MSLVIEHVFEYHQFMTLTTAGAPVAPARAALDAVRAHDQAVRAHELATVTAVLDWVVLCGARDLDTAAHVGDAGELGPFAAVAREEHLTLAGPGAPLVGESMLAELCVALGRSPASGRAWLGAVLEVRYRLPRLWAAVASGRCPLWRARRVAERTIALCEDGAGFVDTHVDGFTHAVSAAQLDRIVETALARWEPEVAEERRRAAAEGRHLRALADAAEHGRRP